MNPLLIACAAFGAYGYVRLVTSLTVARRYVDSDGDDESTLSSQLRTVDIAVAAAALGSALLVASGGPGVRAVTAAFGGSLGFNAIRYRFEIDVSEYLPTYVTGLLAGAYLPLSVALLDVGLTPLFPVDVGPVALVMFVLTFVSLMTRLSSAMTDSGKTTTYGDVNNDGD
ncbi:hypothetical protein [Halostella litorea]|uniref:hypothetical protein n=1 Tax=Halostella litorea TaxID=2528831 RepID=UPI0010923149|nr:hypothetical protein [Halostella litorea]